MPVRSKEKVLTQCGKQDTCNRMKTHKAESKTWPVEPQQDTDVLSEVEI